MTLLLPLKPCSHQASSKLISKPEGCESNSWQWCFCKVTVCQQDSQCHDIKYMIFCHYYMVEILFKISRWKIIILLIQIEIQNIKNNLKIVHWLTLQNGTSFLEQLCKIQKNWCTVTVAPTIEHHGGHSWTPVNQRWDQVPGRSQRLLLG